MKIINNAVISKCGECSVQLKQVIKECYDLATDTEERIYKPVELLNKIARILRPYVDGQE